MGSQTALMAMLFYQVRTSFKCAFTNNIWSVISRTQNQGFRNVKKLPEYIYDTHLRLSLFLIYSCSLADFRLTSNETLLCSFTASKNTAAAFIAGLIYLPAVVACGYYFEKRRALATGISVCGSGNHNLFWIKCHMRGIIKNFQSS